MHQSVDAYLETYAAVIAEAEAEPKQRPELQAFLDRRLAFFRSELERIKKLQANGERFLDIEEGRPFKAGISAALLLFHATIRDREAIRADLAASPRSFIRQIHAALVSVSDDLKNHHQARLIRDVGEALLWVVDKDSAYQDPFEAFLARLQEQPLMVSNLPPSVWWMNLVVRLEEWDGK